MKKILSLALSVLLVFGGLLSAFAAETEPPAGPVVLDAIGQEMPDVFKGATQLKYLDYEEHAENAHLIFAGGEGVAASDIEVRIFREAYGESVSVYKGKKYAVPFSVEEAGTYAFTFQNFIRSGDTWNNIQADGTTKYPHPGTVQIDDGTVYTISANAVLAAEMETFNDGCWFGPVTVELDAGEHTLYLSGTNPNGANPYFMGAKFYQVGNEPEIPADTPPAADPNVPSAIGTEEPDVFKGAEYINFIDYAEEGTNADLQREAEGVEAKDVQVRFYTDYYGPSVGVFNGEKYAVPFETEAAGEYTFIFRMYIRADSIFDEKYRLPSGLTQYPHNGTVSIDGMHTYELTGNKVIEAGMEQFSGGCCVPYSNDAARIELLRITNRGGTILYNKAIRNVHMQPTGSFTVHLSFIGVSAVIKNNQLKGLLILCPLQCRQKTG